MTPAARSPASHGQIAQAPVRSGPKSRHRRQYSTVYAQILTAANNAARTGASIFKIQEISRHRSLQVLAGYVRDVQVYRDHAGSGFL